MTLPNELGVVSVMAASFLLAWLRLATSSSARFGGRQPYPIVRNIPYVILMAPLPALTVAAVLAGTMAFSMALDAVKHATFIRLNRITVPVSHEIARIWSRLTTQPASGTTRPKRTRAASEVAHGFQTSTKRVE